MESEQKTEELIKEFMRRTISRGNFDELDLAIRTIEWVISQLNKLDN